METTQITTVQALCGPTLFMNTDSSDCAFDAFPLLSHLLNDTSPVETAKELDKGIEALTEYFLKENYKHIYASNILFTLRQLRNALLKGAGTIDMEK